MQRDPWFRALLVLGVIIALFHLGSQLWQLARHFGDIIVVFFLAWLLAFCLRPLVRALELVLRFPRPLATGVVYLALFVALGVIGFLIVPGLVTQLVQFGDALPGYLEQLPGLLGSVEAQLHARNVPLGLGDVFQGQSYGAQMERVVSRLVENTVAVASGLASAVVAISIVVVLSFYFVLDGGRLVESIISTIPGPYETEARLFFESVGRAFGGYLRGTFIQVAIFAVGTAVVMAGARLPYLLLASVASGLFVLVPFVGPTLAMVVPIAIAMFSAATWTDVLLVTTAMLVLQVIVVNVVAPKVMGDSVGLHPLVVFLALLVGAKQAGLAGALFGVPVAAVIYASVLILLRLALPDLPVAGDIARAHGSLPARPDGLARLRATVGGAFTRRFSERPEQPVPRGGEGVSSAPSPLVGEGVGVEGGPRFSSPEGDA
ncbi:MAG: AI-2E family transporter [Chloroflexi bacterium]|nr:AI-2E family transporter [Chloroflexota bacterium]